MLARNDRGLADYLLDHYGTCSMGPDCLCIDPKEQRPWLGRACPNWTPAGFRTWEERFNELSASTR